MGITMEELEKARQKTGEVDRHGFFLDEAHLSRGVDASGMPLTLPKKELIRNRKRESKWLDMLNEWDHFMSQKPAKVKSRCRKGIPAALRGRAWERITGSDQLMLDNPGKYQEFVAAADKTTSKELLEYMEIVDRDLDRTFPHNDVFTSKDGEGQNNLREVLRAYVMYNQNIGYCQGMGMIAGTLLMQMPPENSFWCLVRLLEEHLKGFFDAGLLEVQICADILHGLIKQHHPDLHSHLDNNQVTPLLYFTDWFMCAFVKTVPWEAVLRIWDMMVFEGVKILYRVALAILQLSKKQLLTECSDTTDLMLYLRDVPAAIVHPTVLLPQMLNLPLKGAEIEELNMQIAPKYEEKRKEKEEAQKKAEEKRKQEAEEQQKAATSAGETRDTGSTSQIIGTVHL
eukprot:m.49651 g.49651  ORF g.49651 m.49651 type:complete len:399 (-) comp10622_c0_seq7:1571-2767(-)